MNRRGFLGAILAAGVAPAIVRVESLMKIVVPTDAEVVAYAFRSAHPLPPLVDGEFMDELQYITRRAFVPQLVVQIYNEPMFLSHNLILKP